MNHETEIIELTDLQDKTYCIFVNSLPGNALNDQFALIWNQNNKIHAIQANTPNELARIALIEYGLSQICDDFFDVKKHCPIREKYVEYRFLNPHTRQAASVEVVDAEDGLTKINVREIENVDEVQISLPDDINLDDFKN